MRKLFYVLILAAGCKTPDIIPQNLVSAPEYLVDSITYTTQCERLGHLRNDFFAREEDGVVRYWCERCFGRIIESK